MTLVLKQRWNGWRVGKVFDAPDGMAHTLLIRGIAAPVSETAVRRPAERAVSLRERAKAR